VSWLQALVLGLIQGLTEFLPISSSAHLRVFSELFFGSDAGASFTAVTQIGTELAVLIYFAKDIWRLLVTWFRGFFDASVRGSLDYRIAWYVVIGSLPIGVLGFLFEDSIRTHLRNLWITATMLIFFAVLLGLAERFGPQRRSVEQMTLRDGVVMGVAQAMALIPGVSRSGGTITAGLAIGLDRATAARYSFLLAIPAVFAAGIFSIPDVFAQGPGPQPTVAQMVVATLLAFGVAYLTIGWLLNWVARHSVYLFVWYRIVLGLVLIGLLSTGTINAI